MAKSAAVRKRSKARAKVISPTQEAPAAAAEVAQDGFELGDVISEAWRYQVDLWQRHLLFLDTLRERANNMLAHQQAGLPPLLKFEYETVLDVRIVDRPANYALLRVTGQRCWATGKPRTASRKGTVRSSSSIRAPGMAPGSAVSNGIRRSVSRCMRGIRFISSASFQNPARDKRCPMFCTLYTASLRKCLSAILIQPRPSSTATARPAGRSLCYPRTARA